VPDGQVVDASPIIDDPFCEPTRYWHFGEEKPVIRQGRRVSGFLPPGSEGELSITAEIIPIPLVNDIRDWVRAWRDAGYQGASPATFLTAGQRRRGSGRVGHSVRPCTGEAPCPT